MAIAEMTKVIIASHQSQAVELLESLQEKGLVEVLNSEQAMVTKEWPELQTETKRPRDIEEMVVRLEKAVTFLSEYSTEKSSALSPLVEIDSDKYSRVIGGSKARENLEKAEKIQADIEKLNNSRENLQGLLIGLDPWKSLETPVEKIKKTNSVTYLLGLIPHQYYEDVCHGLKEVAAAIEQVGGTGNTHACIVACMGDCTGDVQKILRSGDFEPVHFEGMKGTVKELISENRATLTKVEKALGDLNKQAEKLSEDILSLKILHDHYSNLLNREQTRSNVPMTETTVLLEGWVKTKDFGELQKIISGFDACSVDKIQPGEDENIPVEIENAKAVEPFEAITRLYGMPSVKDVDPTVFLAPFFTLFFGLCLTDAAYGLILLFILWKLLKKLQGDKKFIWMFLVCSVSTVIAGALTGGWFGDAFQVVIPDKYEGFKNGALLFREKLMLFDPMKDPMTFFMLSLGLGYIQILFGLGIALYNNIRQKEYVSAFFEQVTWLIFLNSLLIVGLAKGGLLPAGLSKIFGILAIIQAVLIFLFTERKSGMAGRIGGGVFALFSTVFYFGDVLSYVRLMALGMVTAGLGMAINILVKLLMDVPYVGFILGAVLFVGGHLFNLAMSVLSSFVHSLRLQFVEFFPKFLAGGGKDFVPLKKKYKHVMIKKE